jgi:uncharacterized protein (TIGR02145 family)
MKILFCFVFLLLLIGCAKKEESPTGNTPQNGTVTDIEGNMYKTVTIGTQNWMAENLKTTKYKDGTAIPNVTDNTAWKNLIAPAYCWYNNDILNKTPYGALYNWYTVNTGKLCPSGWHVPTDEEWTVLSTYLGGLSIAGGKLKETGTGHWLNPNTGATNETGFTALPGGYRDSDNSLFVEIKTTCIWLSLSEYQNGALLRRLDYNLNNVGRGDGSKKNGCSVRCIKD